MVASTSFIVGVVFDVVIFFALLLAVLTVFNMNKRTKSIEIRLLDLQDELRQIKQELLRARHDSNQATGVTAPPKAGDA